MLPRNARKPSAWVLRDVLYENHFSLLAERYSLEKIWFAVGRDALLMVSIAEPYKNYFSLLKKTMKEQDHKYLIIGLGNPGEEYAHTYHNVGHLFVDYLAKTRARPFKKDRSFTYQDEEVPILIKTNAYMNESATAVLSALRHFKALPRAMLIAHDDSDLKLGTFKLSEGAGTAGHKGVRSIMDATGDIAIKRLRIGIRPTQEKTRLKAGDFVLKEISNSHKKILYSVFEDIKRSVIEKLT